MVMRTGAVALLALLPIAAGTAGASCYTCDNEAAIRAQAAADQTWAASTEATRQTYEAGQQATVQSWGFSTNGALNTTSYSGGQ